MTLPTLPLELRQQIAACVDTIHRPSLYAFALTSKACHAASTFLIYQQVNITVHDREGLRRDIFRLLEALSRTDSTRHVQRIMIKGALQLDARKSKGDDRKPLWICDGLEEILENEETIHYSDRDVFRGQAVIEKFSEEDMAWSPVVSLLQAIPRLKDLIYDCPSQFPPSLLKTLHEQHPRCRLHHLTFRFRTLLWDAPCPYEIELATSPSLYKVKVACGWQDSHGDYDLNLEAMMQLATGLAPNLKEVIVLGLSPFLALQYFPSRGLWQGLPGYTSRPVGSLTSLSLKGFSSLRSPELLQKWARYTDFSCLQHLTLGGCYDVKTSGLTGETMEWVSQNMSFSKLRTLDVYLNRDDMYQQRPHYSQNAVFFFQTFQYLKELSVTGPIDSSIVHAIVSYHGQTLKKLSLNPFEQTFDHRGNGRIQRVIPMEFTKDHLLHIQAGCPALEELSITVWRNKSSASETELYKCFAKMESLKVLFLTLDCSNWHAPHDNIYDPESYAEDPARGILKETYINRAVDEALARSMWEVISKNKTGKRLERLKLWTTASIEYGVAEGTFWAIDVLNNLSRSWLITRVPRDDQDDITVRELGQREREARDARLRRKRPTETRNVFHEVWPRKEGSESWHDDWSSFPLQM
ncbi:hypothetical protein P280DRAFT_471276 [Massarina eburnea CBS 473.64]|uniref:Uncharacterized protein n=1 Tax=Massarina eburnea CBS 473.64 TaxID=1395130 RepID=A0A6A6RU43_9PLEO|nr:hypothetical protein P280DRAFT_471276 [Massarina eburnea CBS 473.64]